jgi:hypothetical protein
MDRLKPVDFFGMIENMMRRYRSGFNVYCVEAIWPHDEKGLENLRGCRLAQMEPGQQIRFESVSVETAEDEYLRLRKCLESIAESLEPADSEATETYRLLSANLIDGVY